MLTVPHVGAPWRRCGRSVGVSGRSSGTTCIRTLKSYFQEESSCMAVHLEFSATAKARPEHIWRVFEKLEQWAWWNPAIGKTKWTSGQPWQKGSHFSMELERPKRLVFDCEVLDASAAKVGWRGKGNMV